MKPTALPFEQILLEEMNRMQYDYICPAIEPTRVTDKISARIPD